MRMRRSITFTQEMVFGMAAQAQPQQPAALAAAVAPQQVQLVRAEELPGALMNYAYNTFRRPLDPQTAMALAAQLLAGRGSVQAGEIGPFFAAAMSQMQAQAQPMPQQMQPQPMQAQQPPALMPPHKQLSLGGSVCFVPPRFAPMAVARGQSEDTFFKKPSHDTVADNATIITTLSSGSDADVEALPSFCCQQITVK